jgi:acyl transferase domain-containing protein
VSDRPVLLFPGLGAYSTGVLRQASRAHDEVTATFDEINRTVQPFGVPPVSAALFGDHPRSVHDLLAEPAELLQLAIFGVSVSVHRILATLGVRPGLLVGHSFGEIAALVAAGAFTLADGARLVCARAAALQPWEGKGAMAAVGVDEDSAAHLIGVLDEPELVIGCLNAPRQVVLAGPLPAIDRAETVATALNFFFTRLHLPYASHHPAMLPAVHDFMARMSGIRQQPLRHPVYSPIHRRRYTDDDDLRQALADCLVRPVRFTETVRELHAKGCDTFIETGALNALTKCVEQTVPGVRTFAPLADPEHEADELRVAAQMCRDSGLRQPGQAEVQVVAPPAAAVPPAQRPPDRAAVVARLRDLYAEVLEYPPDLLTEDALLEAELGVDSLKQTSLLTKVVERFGLAEQPGELRVWELPTLGRIADYVTRREPAR